jgi:hypothetical protein
LRAGTPLPRNFQSPESYTPKHGQAEQDQEHLATATTMYREMVMRFWLEKTEMSSRNPGVRTTVVRQSRALWAVTPPLPVATPRLQLLQQQTQRRKGGLILGAVGSVLRSE